MSRFSNGNKSQADQIAIIRHAGWMEATDTSLPWRWFDPARPGTYYTLSHAVGLMEAQKRGVSRMESQASRICREVYANIGHRSDTR